MRFKTDKTDLLEIVFNPLEPNILNMIQYSPNNSNKIITQVEYHSVKDLTKIIL